MRRRVALLLPAAVMLTACGSGADAGRSTGPVVDAATRADTETSPVAVVDDGSDAATDEPGERCDEVAASFATKGSANDGLPDPEVDAVCVGGSIIVTSNGIPDYTYLATSPGVPEAVDLEATLPATPKIADATAAVPLLGTAAIATNGVPIYGPTEATGGDVLSLVGALGDCGSHNGPTGFHIHLFGTSATTDCVFTPDEAAAEPQLLGYALDGFPIYTGNDQYASSWQLTDEALFASDTWAAHGCVAGSGDLDECNGRFDDEGGYAYYTTDSFPYVIGCYRGVVDFDDAGGGAGGHPAGPPVQP